MKGKLGAESMGFEFSFFGMSFKGSASGSANTRRLTIIVCMALMAVIVLGCVLL